MDRRWLRIAEFDAITMMGDDASRYTFSEASLEELRHITAREALLDTF